MLREPLSSNGGMMQAVVKPDLVVGTMFVQDSVPAVKEGTAWRASVGIVFHHDTYSRLSFTNGREVLVSAVDVTTRKG